MAAASLNFKTLFEAKHRRGLLKEAVHTKTRASLLFGHLSFLVPHFFWDEKQFENKPKFHTNNCLEMEEKEMKKMQNGFLSVREQCIGKERTKEARITNENWIDEGKNLSVFEKFPLFLFFRETFSSLEIPRKIGVPIWLSYGFWITKFENG